MTAGLVIIFAGYAITSYGVVLLRGYNIPWKQWINPLNPWSWQTGVTQTPATQILPS